MGKNTKSFQWAKKQNVDNKHKLYAFSFETDEDYFYNNLTPDRFLWSLTIRRSEMGTQLVGDLLEEYIELKTKEQQTALNAALDLNTPVTEEMYKTLTNPLAKSSDTTKATFCLHNSIMSFLWYRCSNDTCFVFNCLTSLLKYMKYCGKSDVYQIVSDWIHSKLSFDTWIATFDDGD